MSNTVIVNGVNLSARIAELELAARADYRLFAAWAEALEHQARGPSVSATQAKVLQGLAAQAQARRAALAAVLGLAPQPGGNFPP